MSSNIPNFNPAVLSQLYSLFNNIIKTYLLNNVFTIDLMEVAKVNEDNTINLKSVLYNLDTDNNIIENNATIDNIKVMMLKGGASSISFNCEVGDIGLYLSLKKDYGKYLKNSTDNTITNDILFNIANGVFIPFQLNNISSSLIIRNGSGTIEINNDIININASNVNITAQTLNKGNIKVEGNTNIDGDLITNGNCESQTYSANNQAGISGTFIDTPSGKSITFTNGIITAQA